MNSIIKIENLSKQYRLGIVGTGTISNDLKRWYYKIRGKEDPFLKIGEINDRSTHSNSDYVWALKDINLEVKPGEVLGIIGKNGAGKSTLLKLLSKVTGPTTGRILFNGRIGSLLEVGTGFHPELTGRENIFLNGAILGMTKVEIKNKLDEIIDFSGCERYLDTPVKRYSSGMMVRLGFAVAAHLEPEILVVDEVLAVGDAEFQKKAIGKMQDVSKGEGKTVLFVSHNMASIQKLCTRTIILKNGTINFHGDTEMAIDYYLNNLNNSDKKYIPVSEIKDRNGSGTVKITDIYINKDNNQFEYNLIAGQKVTFEVHYRSKQNKPIKHFDLGIAFFNNKKEFITVLNSKMSQDKFWNLPPNGSVSCKIPKLPLISGDFYINITLQIDSQLSDQIENVKKISVEAGDYYGTGESNAYNRQGVYIDQKWIN